jgi:hypothetical protein
LSVLTEPLEKVLTMALDGDRVRAHRGGPRRPPTEQPPAARAASTAVKPPARHSRPPGPPDHATAGQISCDELRVYRAAVSDLLLEVAGLTDPSSAPKLRDLLSERLRVPELTRVLAPGRPDMPDATRRLLSEISRYEPNSRSSARDLTALVRIFLLSQIDVLWWGDARPYQSDVDVLTANDLVDLERLRRDGRLAFRYRLQPGGLPGRLSRAVLRRMAPDRTPRTAGLRFARTRQEAVTLLSQLAADFATAAPAGTPPLWVTSLTRSVSHQHHLRALGYAALLPSAHCTGYAMDIEMSWFRRFDADRILQELLLQRQATSDVNVIDEGQAWHVCIGPVTAARLRQPQQPPNDPAGW